MTVRIYSYLLHTCIFTSIIKKKKKNCAEQNSVSDSFCYRCHFIQCATISLTQLKVIVSFYLDLINFSLFIFDFFYLIVNEIVIPKQLIINSFHAKNLNKKNFQIEEYFYQLANIIRYNIFIKKKYI